MKDEFDATFLYFKPTGKWKYDGRGNFPKEEQYDVPYRQNIKKYNNGRMPGISTDGKDLVIVVIPDDDCDVPTAYPRMVGPEV